MATTVLYKKLSRVTKNGKKEPTMVGGGGGGWGTSTGMNAVGYICTYRHAITPCNNE